MSVGGECQMGRVFEWGRVCQSQCPMPDARCPIPDANFLLLVNAIEQPKSPENPDKVGNSGVSISEYHKYV